jgi:hypothetical protein
MHSGGRGETKLVIKEKVDKDILVMPLGHLYVSKREKKSLMESCFVLGHLQRRDANGR